MKPRRGEKSVWHQLRGDAVLRRVSSSRALGAFLLVEREKGFRSGRRGGVGAAPE